MEKTLMQKIEIFSMNFDFTSAEQKAILQYLQANNYKLTAYKGATGPNQVSSGVPTWFSVSYVEIFGELEIDYEPKYKVYVFNQTNINVNTRILMQAISDETPLGTGLTFNPDGTFHRNSGAPEGVINVINNRPAGTPPVTIGLAAKVNGKFLPFCAFICAPQESVSMKPNEKIVLLASQNNMTSGTVAGNMTGPGCSFTFSAQNMRYDLEMIPENYGIQNVPGTIPVDPVASGASLVQLLNIS
ncbi:hypothetical protein [Chryseobacterium sp. 22458]|uniref:hypothetical protein n=1 Tax=Chryseobacterium sp. 22458 TaxID=3453921 RepID=UPI003F842223